MTNAQWLTLIKQHIRMEATVTDEDDYLLQLRNTAAEAVKWQIDEPPTPPDDVDLPETEISTTEEEETPPQVVQAMLLLIGELYNRREITGEKATELPKGYDFLLGTKRNYTIA